MREVCFVIGRGDAILHADASDSPAALPDSRARWEAIWQHRAELEAIAHSHPMGPSAFSAEDDSTMAAIDSALGRAVRYYVVAPRVVIAREGELEGTVSPEPWWAEVMRLASGMRKER
ncbi:MAG TPA: Mov34/MPN/PAD-1 family protein [Kofleriaceae bacterium]|nr:Mov34/MPN/PAD-1 family protein [Kofleriaceae bacterium]